MDLIDWKASLIAKYASLIRWCTRISGRYVKYVRYGYFGLFPVIK